MTRGDTEYSELRLKIPVEHRQKSPVNQPMRLMSSMMVERGRERRDCRDPAVNWRQIFGRLTTYRR